MAGVVPVEVIGPIAIMIMGKGERTKGVGSRERSGRELHTLCTLECRWTVILCALDSFVPVVPRVQ